MTARLEALRKAAEIAQLRAKCTAGAKAFTSRQLQRAIRKLDPKADVRHLWDSTYLFPREYDFRKALGVDELETERYVAQIYDCDNFARDLPGRIQTLTGCNCVGMILDSKAGHAYSIAGVNRGNNIKLIVIEPQTDDSRVKLRSTFYQLDGASFLWG